MTIKAVQVKVRRSEVIEPVAIFAAWELPILEAMHLEVAVLQELTLPRDPPDALAEYQRLETRYGRTTNEDGTRGLPFVAAVYGQFNVGQSRLADAIKAATVEAPTGAEDLLGEQTAA
jgi:hypothetical protein